MALSHHNPATIFVCANRIFKSTDRGDSWKTISPDLTTNTDRDTLKLMDVLGKDTTLARNDGVSSYGNIVSFSESPRRAGVYYAGSDDGQVQVTRDDGANWSNVTSKISGLPANTYVSELAASRFDEGTIYATFDGHRLNDFNSYVYVSRDFGQNWQSITGDLPKGQVVRTITEDLKTPDVLYLGTESGLFVSIDRGKRWVRVKANFPTVPVYEITLHPRDNALILATHGRSIWILDDLTPIQQYAKAQTADAYLFETRPAIEWSRSNERMREFEGDMKFLGKNPEVGAQFTYYLKSATKNLSITVKDSSGNTVREFSGDKVKGKGEAGLNLFVWDLRVEPLTAPRQPQQGGGGGGFFGGGLDGPFVLPGSYQVAVKVDGKDAASGSFNVAGDPEINISDADRRAWFDTAMQLHRLQKTLNEAAESVGALNERIRSIQQALKDTPEAPSAIKSKVEELAKKFAPVGRRFGVGAANPFETGNFERINENLRFRIGGLKSSIMSATARPTETQIRMIPEARSLLERTIDEANALINSLPALYKELAENGIYPSPVKPITK
jgi:hypothetical protein